MSIKSFVQDKTTFDEVFDYIEKYVDTYALRQIYAGEDVSGIKNALEIIKKSKSAMLAEGLEPSQIKKLDRSV